VIGPLLQSANPHDILMHDYPSASGRPIWRILPRSVRDTWSDVVDHADRELEVTGVRNP